MSKRLKRFLACPHNNVQQFTECCLDCGENIYTTEKEIRKQEKARKKTEKETEEEWNYHGW